MQQLLCEPEDRIGSQASSSTARPNSLVVQARRSGFVDATGSRLGVDGAELIKVRGARLAGFENSLSLNILRRLTHGSAALIGKIYTVIRHLTARKCVIPPTLNISTMIFRLR
jgi:hypothetical protein